MWVSDNFLTSKVTMTNRSFLVGGTATFAIVLLVFVSLFAAYKPQSSNKSRSIKDQLSVYKPADTKADGPYAAVEHFCEVGMCTI
jgi:protein-S-isoprenylcysteine O-methyltransferase Ste14